MRNIFIPVILTVFIFSAAAERCQAFASEPVLPQEFSELRSLTQQEDRQRLSQILQKSLLRYEEIKNYRAIFSKQERSDGKMGPVERIFLKFEKPWKIYMGWLNTEKKDLQVVYERGKHKGRLAIHKPGLALGLVPVVFLDQNSPWIKKGSESYNIEDAGIGTFLHDFTKAVMKAARENKLKILFKNDLKSPAEGESLEVVFDGSQENTGFFAYRVAVEFDRVNYLPVKMRLYDWKDELMGDYAYEDLKINLASEDPEFKNQINRFLYRVYKG